MGKSAEKLNRKRKPEEEPEDSSSEEEEEEEEDSSGEEEEEDSGEEEEEEDEEEEEEEDEEGEDEEGEDEEGEDEEGEDEEGEDEEGEDEEGEDEEGEEEEDEDKEEKSKSKAKSSKKESTKDKSESTSSSSSLPSDEPYTPHNFFEVRIGNDKSVRAVAVPREAMAFGNEIGPCVYNDKYIKGDKMVTLFLPGDLTWAAGAKNGAAAGMGTAHNVNTKDYRRMIQLGFKQSGTMGMPDKVVIDWMREELPKWEKKGGNGITEKSISALEKAIADPKNYEVCDISRLKLIGPPTPKRRATSRRGSKAEDDSTSDAAPPQKRQRTDDGSSSGGNDDLMLFILAFGEGMAHAARRVLDQRNASAQTE